jgi:hypothetical protein
MVRSPSPYMLVELGNIFLWCGASHELVDEQTQQIMLLLWTLFEEREEERDRLCANIRQRIKRETLCCMIRYMFHAVISK